MSEKLNIQIQAELDAIRKQSQLFVAAFNKRDAKAVATCWTEDGEFIDDTGRRWAGRECLFSNVFEHTKSWTIGKKAPRR